MRATPFDASHSRPRRSSRPSDRRRPLSVRGRWAFGLLLSINFAVFWALPIVVQGQAYKRGLRRVLDPLYARIDTPALRRFAARWIYQRPVHADYFARTLLLVLSTTIAASIVTWWQIAHGSLPIWLVFLYYLAWVGFGGRTMGGAYTFAHREGHRPGGRLYRPWIRKTLGNVVENWLGEPRRPEWASYLDYMEGHLRKLLSDYGPVSALWFDGLAGHDKYDPPRFHRLIRELSPSTIAPPTGRSRKPPLIPHTPASG